MVIFFLLLYFAIILAVVEIHVILFHLTGLKKEVSRFQVISMMTGTGYTTGESEFILSHPFRRKLGIFLILFGAFSLAVIISSVSSLLEDELRTMAILYIAGFVFLLFTVVKLPIFQSSIKKKLNLEEGATEEEITTLPLRSVSLDEAEESVFEYQIKGHSPLLNGTIEQILEQNEKADFSILFIKRGDVKFKRELKEKQLQSGDKIFFYGEKDDIESLLEKVEGSNNHKSDSKKNVEF